MSGGALALAAAAAALAGAMNSAAGGGSFVSFPTFVFLGVPPVPANATNSSAMWVGGLGSIGGFRGLIGLRGRELVGPGATCIAGGITGGLLLLATPSRTFSAFVPWLLLFSTLLFAGAPLLRRRTGGDRVGRPDLPFWAYLPLFVVAVYGGYFGGGQGIMLLALFALAGMTDVARMNALKVVLAFINNGVSIVPFVVERVLVWDLALAASAGALAGGYLGARIVRRLPAPVVRWAIVATGAAMSIVFFARQP